MATSLSAASMIQTFLVQVSGAQGVFRLASSAKDTTSLEIGTPDFRGKQNLLYIQQRQIIFFESRGRNRFFFTFLLFSFFSDSELLIGKVLFVRDAPLR